MSRIDNLIWRHQKCDECAFDFGYVNSICANCPDKIYAKHSESSFMTRETAEKLAEALNIVLPKEDEE